MLTLKRSLKDLLKVLFSIIFGFCVLNYNSTWFKEIDPYEWKIELNKDQKKILLWTRYFRDYQNWKWIFPNKIITGCRDQDINNKCVVTSDKRMIRNVDAVMFSLEDIDSTRAFRKQPRFPDITNTLRRNQMWIAVWFESKIAVESHRYTYFEEGHLDGKFNGTISYRSDSLFDAGFYFHYNFVKSSKVLIEDTRWSSVVSKAKLKDPKVAWIVSNCNSWSYREKYVKEMQQYGEIDIFGKCGSLSIEHGQELDVLAKYKFYLSFENSLCDEYATEKIARVLEMSIDENPPVPIVMGPKKSWYEAHLPPNSFIHVGDFKSPKDLMNHLQYLNENHGAYIEHLKWRRTYFLKRKELNACNLCKVSLSIKGDENEKPVFETIDNFDKFWTNEKCDESYNKKSFWERLFHLWIKLGK